MRTVGGLLLGAVALLVAVAVEARAETDVIGVVKTVSGEAVLERAGGPVAAVVGGDVFRKDRLRTGADGSIGIALNDGSLVSLGPSSVFELSAFEFAPRQGAFEFLGSILGGTLLYSTGKIGKIAPGKTRLRTPTSVVAVRGTRLAIRVPAAGGN